MNSQKGGNFALVIATGKRAMARAATPSVLCLKADRPEIDGMSIRRHSSKRAPFTEPVCLLLQVKVETVCEHMLDLGLHVRRLVRQPNQFIVVHIQCKYPM